jgi:hypothetical protein
VKICEICGLHPLWLRAPPLCAPASLRSSSGAVKERSAETSERLRTQLLQTHPSLGSSSLLAEKSSKNKQLYFTKSAQSRLEKCSSHGSLPCVGNSSAARFCEVVLLPHSLECSPAIAARLGAFLPELNISERALPFSVWCLVFSAFPAPVRKTPKSKNTTIRSDISENCPTASSEYLVRKENPRKPNQNAKIASSRPVSPAIRSEIPFSEHLFGNSGHAAPKRLWRSAPLRPVYIFYKNQN